VRRPDELLLRRPLGLARGGVPSGGSTKVHLGSWRDVSLAPPGSVRGFFALFVSNVFQPCSDRVPAGFGEAGHGVLKDCQAEVVNRVAW
jgi:hypothetical protein